MAIDANPRLSAKSISSEALPIRTESRVLLVLGSRVRGFPEERT